MVGQFGLSLRQKVCGFEESRTASLSYGFMRHCPHNRSALGNHGFTSLAHVVLEPGRGASRKECIRSLLGLLKRSVVKAQLTACGDAAGQELRKHARGSLCREKRSFNINGILPLLLPQTNGGANYSASPGWFCPTVERPCSAAV